MVDLEDVKQLLKLPSSSIDYLALLALAHEAIDGLVTQARACDPAEGLA
jgi:hypothetical protein